MQGDRRKDVGQLVAKGFGTTERAEQSAGQDRVSGGLYSRAREAVTRGREQTAWRRGQEQEELTVSRPAAQGRNHAGCFTAYADNEPGVH